MRKRIGVFLLLLTLFFIALSCPVHGASRQERQRAALIQKLKQAVDPRLVDSVFADPRCTIDHSLFSRRRSGGYAYLRDPARIERGKEFLETESELLWRVYLAFGVEPEALAAVFAAETDFGNFLGRHAVFPALYTRYLTAGPKRRAMYYRNIVSFLTVSPRDGIDPFETPSSSTGAWGLFQFMPRSYEVFAFDWDGDGARDLFNLSDAMASAANFLMRNGWGKTAREKLRALRAYNKRRYATAVYRYTLVIAEDGVPLPRVPPMDPLPFSGSALVLVPAPTVAL